jgi:hypothetical protein
MTKRNLLTTIMSAFSGLTFCYGLYQMLLPTRIARASEVCCQYTSDCKGDGNLCLTTVKCENSGGIAAGNYYVCSKNQS